MARFDDDDDKPVMTLDDLLGPVPDTESIPLETHYLPQKYSSATSNSVSDKNPSKSQRVRDFLDAQPDARNRDVVEALAEYGVTAADVSNAKAQLKRKGDTPTRRGRPPASAAAAAAVAPAASKASSAAVAQAAGGSIAMNELESALTFVRQIGSIDRAKQLLVIIQQIQLSTGQP